MDKYKVLSCSILLLMILYIGISQYLVLQGVGAGTSWQILFTGPPRLEIRDNVLRVTLKIDFSALELKLVQPLKECFGNVTLKNKQTIKGECSRDRDWIMVYAPPGQSLRDLPIVFNVANPQRAEPLGRRYVTIIRVDRRPVNIPDAYQNIIDINQSNVSMFYPFHVFNISTYLAELFGVRLMWLIQSTLLVLLTCQLILFLVSWVWQPGEVTKYFESGEAVVVTLVDALANNFAIPLGFLGTVTSIWYSLEMGQADYASFNQVLEAMRVAVFTTVLGLFIKILCLLRGYKLKTPGRTLN